MNMIISSLIGISAVSPVRASDHASNLAHSDRRVFVLRGITEPAAVVSPEQALASGEMYMRLPDLQGVGPQHGQVAAKNSSPAGRASGLAGAQGDSNIHSDSRIDSHSPNHVNGHDADVKPNHRAALSRSSLNQSERSKPLTFKPTKVSGEVRLPRVQFSRRGPPLELSDDMPSLDFTGKSLKDSGF
jgi:hypothetical protein